MPLTESEILQSTGNDLQDLINLAKRKVSLESHGRCVIDFDLTDGDIIEAISEKLKAEYQKRKHSDYWEKINKD